MTTVLLVDDSATILMSLSAILTKNGFQVATATDGMDAMAKLAAVKPHLIITDLNMPRMDGMVFIQQVRKRDRQ